jgi:hypothetical protein
MIAAAIGGALVAGAPLVLAAATPLFAGIGILAAAQSEKVKTAWANTWEGIKSSAIQDAGPIEDVLVGLADRVAGRFAQLRPQLAGIFIDVAPQIDVFASGLLDLTDNALPGFERAIERGMPVTQGLADFLAKTGTGLTGFLDNISAHAPAAGKAFSLIGDVVAELLPTLGELLGQGAELATIVLPPMVSILGGLNTVLDHTGGLLPVVVAGFAAMKIVQAVGGMLGGFSTRMAGAAQSMALASAQGGVFGRAASGAATAATGVALGADKASRAIGGMGAGLPILGVMFGMIGSQLSNVTAEEERWAQALVQGGSAAAKVREEMAGQSDYLLRGLDEWTGLASSVSDAESEYRKVLASMDPVSRGQALVTQATNDLSFAIGKHGVNSDEAKAAQARLNVVTHEATRAQEAHELALNGVTTAMLNQLDQIRAAADAEFAHRQAVEGSADAFTTYKDAIREHGAASEEATDAALGFESALRAEADAASRLATDALPATASETDRLNAANVGHLGKLYELERKYGTDLPAAMQHEIKTMESSMTAAQRAGAEFSSLGLSILNVPNSKTVIVSSTTPEQQAMLEKLGFTVEHLPDGTVRVAAQTAAAEGAMNHTARPRTSVVYSQGNASHGESVLNWSARHRSALISAGADVYNAERHLNWVSRNRTVTIWTNTITDRKAGGPVGSPIGAAFGRKVVGPGGPTDDLVPATGPGGSDYRLSNGEWIIKAMGVARLERAFGNGIMPMINEGRLPVEPKRPSVGRFAAATGTATSSQATLDRPPVAAGGITVNTLNVKIETPLNLTSSADLRRAGVLIRDVIVNLERESR